MSMTSALGCFDLHADGRRQAVAHRAEAARGHPAVRLLEMKILRRPHLVLADLGGDVGVAVLGQRIEALQRVLRLDDRVRAACRRGSLARPPGVGSASTRRSMRGLVGLGARLAPDPPACLVEHMRAIADDTDIDLDRLVDRGRIDVDVDLLRVRREGVDTAGDAVVEARADRIDHDVAVVHRQVGLVGAVHAEHAEPLLVGGREGAETHQRRGHGIAGQPRQLAQQRRSVRAGIDDAAAGVEDPASSPWPSARPQP